MLQILQHRHAGPQNAWVLKSPQHLEQLPALPASLPDATVVFTHRDPVAVIQSTVTMLGCSHRMARDSLDMPGLLAYWTDRIARLREKGVEDRPLVPADRSYDLLFHEVMADTEGRLDHIYGMPRTERSRAEQAAFGTTKPSHCSVRRDYG